MHALGIIKFENRLRWALLWQEKELVIERLEEGDSIPEEVLNIKNLKIVTGLDGASVLRRDLKLPLIRERALKATLPFQLEPILPFPLSQTVVFPQFYPAEKETVVVVWASTQDHIRSHLERWQEMGMDPDFISSQTLALARWARHFFPETPQLVAVLGGQGGGQGTAIDGGCVVCAMDSPDPARLKLFLQQKYGHFHWIEEVSPFAIAIGLALEAIQKKPCQFRPPDLPSERQKRHQGMLFKTTFALGTGLTLLAAAVSTSILRYKESVLKEQIAPFYTSPSSDLETTVERFRNHILKEAKAIPPIFDLPSTQEVLSWISSLDAPVEVTHFEYELKKESLAQVSLEFQAKAPSDADQFIKKLENTPTFVEPTHELKWTSHPHGYKISFFLQKNS